MEWNGTLIKSIETCDMITNILDIDFWLISTHFLQKPIIIPISSNSLAFSKETNPRDRLNITADLKKFDEAWLQFIIRYWQAMIQRSRNIFFIIDDIVDNAILMTCF